MGERQAKLDPPVLNPGTTLPPLQRVVFGTNDMRQLHYSDPSSLQSDHTLTALPMGYDALVMFGLSCMRQSMG